MKYLGLLVEWRSGNKLKSGVIVEESDKSLTAFSNGITEVVSDKATLTIKRPDISQYCLYCKNFQRLTTAASLIALECSDNKDVINAISVYKSLNNMCESGSSDSDSDSESESSSESSDESSSSISSDESDDDDDGTFDVKLVKVATKDARFLRVKKFKSLESSAREEFEIDSETAVLTFHYIDDEGDRVLISSTSSLKCAYSSHKAFRRKNKDSGKRMLRLEFSVSEEGKVKSKSGNSSAFESASPGVDNDYMRNSRNLLLSDDLNQDNFAGYFTTQEDTVGRRRISGSARSRTRSVSFADDSSTIEQENSSSYALCWQRGEVIGQGSFGRVFSGIDTFTGRRIAVKEVYLCDGNRYHEQIKSLIREIGVLSALDHPNIIRYYGAESGEGCLRIFFEISSEGSVKDTLREFGALSENVLRRYTIDILNGLAYLHSQDIIHRDIKPSNLLLVKNVVKIADFGCSTLVEVADNFTSSKPKELNDSYDDCNHGTVAGTTIYMSPEVMRTEVTYGRKADIWSLGVTLCEMAHGKPPFTNAPAAIYAICVSKIFPSFPSTMSVDAHEFLARLLVEEPKLRSSCNSLLKDKFLCNSISDNYKERAAITGTATRLLSSSISLMPSGLNKLNNTKDLDAKSDKRGDFDYEDDFEPTEIIGSKDTVQKKGIAIGNLHSDGSTYDSLLYDSM